MADTTSVPGVTVPDTPETIKIVPRAYEGRKPEATLIGNWTLHFGTLPELIFQSDGNMVEVYGLRPEEDIVRASLIVHLEHKLAGCYRGKIWVVFGNGDRFPSRVSPGCTEIRLIAANFGAYEEIGKAIEEALPTAIEQGRNVIRLKAHGVKADIQRFRRGIRPVIVERVTSDGLQKAE
ncbi:hypothetical protein [Oecophyllibacter saccharovorans]|uniref:hypothetical protein n=1 Tax=Oecophyllibacter saccharovorans TaxID=2558360 RepID=UPI001142A961|nr:hypothetical protein [Oecophyllibacter saccharovorans]QDH15760.1 hypothetical protein E3E11_07775 [Oecophyllibacter saccharovorans]TPW36780.1 hypothetical protein E3203_03340 [Oecophyllibacter saccharovorans]